MVDVSDKPEIVREAQAVGTIRLKAETVKMIKAGKIEKGDPLRMAEVAGILAAKQTSTLIPLCHPLPLTKVKVQAEIKDLNSAQVLSTVKTKARTGVEMEALVAASASLLTIWDMVKQYEKDEKGQYPATVIQEIRVIKKIKEGADSERKHKKTQS
ncbi:cyclic pyranopterin monophosphate synthase MoaC [Candidatus Bathyarchaeota archaeon]|nr:cyclic pyranopterin monophosphate synthase MoaC [Candidatus Bathyarchaeota archaeon]